MSEREDAVARVLQHHNTTDPRNLPLLTFLEACQPGLRRTLDKAAADRGLTIDHTGKVTPKEQA